MKYPLLLFGIGIAFNSISQEKQMNLKIIFQSGIPESYNKSISGKGIDFINRGFVWASKDYINTRTGTADSYRGELKSASLKIYYDIGWSAGTHMAKLKEKECISYYDTMLNKYEKGRGVLIMKDSVGKTHFMEYDKNVFAGIMKDSTGKMQLAVTILPDYANFWATVENENDIAEVLKIALSFEPWKPKPYPLNKD